MIYRWNFQNLYFHMSRLSGQQLENGWDSSELVTLSLPLLTLMSTVSHPCCLPSCLKYHPILTLKVHHPQLAPKWLQTNPSERCPLHHTTSRETNGSYKGHNSIAPWWSERQSVQSVLVCKRSTQAQQLPLLHTGGLGSYSISTSNRSSGPLASSKTPLC